MSEPSPVLRQYEIIAAVTSQMLEEARTGRWDEVTILGAQYQEAVHKLRDMDPLSETDHVTQRRLLMQILDNDAKIRQLTSPELNRLGKLLGDMRRQNSVIQAYCAPSTKQ